MRDTFFNLVLHSEGYYSVLGLKKGAMPQQFMVKTLADVDGLVQKLLVECCDIYFACAKFITDQNRKADNAKWFKSYRLDVDCGEGKPYATQREAVIALKAFASKLSLPKPIIVNSGRGLHVYWPLAEAVLSEDWQPVAEALQKACEFNGFAVDPSVTKDAARILRIPGTKNFKDEQPKDVRIVQMADAVVFADFRELLKAYAPSASIPVPKTKFSELDPVTQALMGNKVSNFGEIMRASLKGQGCGQLAEIYKNQAVIDYNLWRGGLSIAINCEDGAAAIHKLSSKHPEYSPQETELKAQDTLGKPYKCETFANINSPGCTKCTHQGKITSPIQICQTIAEADPEDNKVTVPDPETGEPVEQEIRKYPFPYIRGKNGGIYRRGLPLPDGTRGEDELIWPTDFYLVGRLIDPDLGECIKLRNHTPKDGIKEFLCPYTSVVSKEKLSAALAKEGMPATNKKLDNIMAYITKCIEDLQSIDRAEVARNQFGWCDNDTKFIIGNREITPEQVRYSPSSAATAEVATFYGKKGNIHDWGRVANFYDQPGNEVRAFCLFAGFGSALLKFTKMEGAIIHLTNNGSGVGKTTIQLMINSIWGHPRLPLLDQEDTYLSRIQRTVVLGNLPLTVDELTNLEDREVSDMCYNITMGRARNRMKSQVNAERSNSLRWSLIAITSGNKSLHDQLFSLKDFPEGELMRMMEFSVSKEDVLSKAQTDELFEPVYENYGVAGEIFMRYVVTNLGEVLKLIKSVQRKFDEACKFTQRERFWSAVCAVSLASGIIGNKLGLFKIDQQRVFRWLVQSMIRMRIDIRPNITGPAGHLGQFLNEKTNNILVINNESDARSGLFEIPLKEPRGELMVRYEPDTNHMFVTVKAFREWCSENQISYKGVKELMMGAGVVIRGEVKKCMSKGMAVKSPAVWALDIDCTKITEFNINNLVPEGGLKLEEPSK